MGRHHHLLLLLVSVLLTVARAAICPSVDLIGNISRGGVFTLPDEGIACTVLTNITVGNATTFQVPVAGVSVTNVRLYVPSNSTLTFEGGRIKFKNNVCSQRDLADGQFGGGVLFVNGKVEFHSEASFSSNSVAYDLNAASPHFGLSGGAVYCDGGSIVFSKDVSFTDNSAAGPGTWPLSPLPPSKYSELNDTGPYNNNYGGAIYNSKDGQISFYESATLYRNSAPYGGAIRNEGTMTFTNKQATFRNNTACQGGAIRNTGTIIFGGKAKFDLNIAVGDRSTGGAITNSGQITFKGEANFTNSQATYGGAVSSAAADPSTCSIVFESDAYFDKNTAYTDPLWSNPTEYVSTGLIGRGGSLDISGSLTTGGSNVEFRRSVTFTRGAASNSGGAIHINAKSKLLVVGTATFIDNDAGVSGGALFCSDSLVSVNRQIEPVGPSEVTFQGAVVFKQNSATRPPGGGVYGQTDGVGGAVCNFRSSTAAPACAISFASTVQFVENTAEREGGALFDAGGTSSASTDMVTFSNNRVLSPLNASNDVASCTDTSAYGQFVKSKSSAVLVKGSVDACPKPPAATRRTNFDAKRVTEDSVVEVEVRF